ncbi:hypothetical protein CHU92_13970 [Flavobacterium cyanobacteriorum]|uniref:BZIP transcription factor n=1 Tax=Flavobacterium cyanobacteriorum TaxID=2022802 RepID=A0A255YUX9_9FLAO|nr:hypothetical protein [Flavobacterium cyanobacteriorum]OYQ33023.1 hypothetical protein CHU92_13970 [Flavobacterium cyanobacteriorum]
MKNLFSAGFFLLFLQFSNAQTTIYTGDGTLSATRTVTMNGKHLTFKPTTGSVFINGSNGNVGINTSSPSEKLDVNGSIRASSAKLSNSLSNGQTFTSWEDRNLKCQVLTGGMVIDVPSQARLLNFFDFPSSNYNPTPEVFFTIADRSAKNRFAFNAEQGSGGYFRLFDKNQEINFRVTDDGNSSVTIDLPKTNSRIVVGGWANYLPEHKFVVRGSSMIEGNVLTDSNIGIGTSSFTDGSDNYRLSVNGNIRAYRVKVYTTWADYVFEDDYELPTLEEVEQHIKEKGHLKDIPSAKEVEAKGIELGEMNKLLLQKIEELTLYTIELNKELKILKEQLNKK